MNSAVVDFVEPSTGETVRTERGLCLSNLLAHLRRRQETLLQAVGDLTHSFASTTSHGEPGHEHSEVDHRRS